MSDEAVYLDASAVLRVVLGQPGQLRGFRSIEVAVTSVLAEVECLRTIDRLVLRRLLDPAEGSRRRAAVYDILEAVDRVDLTRAVVERASQPFPTPLGTLDALHLATALLWKETRQQALTLATHDSELALCARASGLRVLDGP